MEDGSDAMAGRPAQRASDVLVRTEALTKRFGRRLVVDGVNLEVQRGDVFGLLGPNGSGKTTTIRMLLGLVWPTSGHIALFGEDVERPGWRRAALQRVGAIVEQPAFYPFLSGRENLAGVATFAGLANGAATRERIETVLAQVGLAPHAGEAYRKYSLGMKQRLGIAATLMTDPELVLLDEPTNGLDPAGMVEVRALIVQLAQRGTTVFLSSHLLHEVQQVCTRVAILQDGRLLRQGTVDEMLATGSGVQVAFVDPADYPRAVSALQEAQAGGVSWLNGAQYIAPDPGTQPPPGGWYLLVNAPAERAPDLNRLLADKGLYVADLRRREASLEQFFLTLTGAFGAPAPQAPAAVQAGALAGAGAGSDAQRGGAQ